MRTTARNCFTGTVTAMTVGPIHAEVVMSVSETLTLAAVITANSAKSLALAPGVRVYALIKANFVLLAAEGEGGRTSARNVMPGTVTRRDDGVINSEIELAIDGGGTLVALITRQSADSLALTAGGRAVALIKASHITVAVD
jgi:molybdate transport system regulatory protein